MRILGITLVFVLCTFKASYGDKDVPETTPQLINNPVVLPQFMMMWNLMYYAIKNVPAQLNKLNESAEMTYTFYKDDLLNKILNTEAMEVTTSSRPKLISRTRDPIFNQTCFEQNKNTFKIIIEDYYTQEVRSSCLRDINILGFYVQNCDIPEWRTFLNRIEHARNNSAYVGALQESINQVHLNASCKPHLSPGSEGISAYIQPLEKRFNAVNGLLLEWVHGSLMHCQANDEIKIHTTWKDQIDQEIKASLVWQQGGDDQSRSCQSITRAPIRGVERFEKKHTQVAQQIRNAKKLLRSSEHVL